MSTPSILRKLTVAQVIGDVQVLLRSGKLPGKKEDGTYENGHTIPLMEILSNVSGVEAKETDYGTSWKLLGSFEGVNLLDGTVHQAPVCYLPPVISDLVAGQLHGHDGDTVQFAGTIGLKVDHKAATGYTYTFTPKVLKAVDLLAELRAAVAALPAPTAAEAETKKKK